MIQTQDQFQTENPDNLINDARAVAASIFAKIRRSNPDALTTAEQKVLGWAVRLLERPSTLSTHGSPQAGCNGSPASLLPDDGADAS